MQIKKIISGEIPLQSQITVKGWIRTRRDSKAGFSFLEIYDGSCFASIQVVVSQSLVNYQSEVLKLTAGCSVEVQGILVPSQGRGQAVEVQAEKIHVYGFVEDPDTYPIQPKQHSFEYLREVAHLRARTNTFGAVARVRHSVAMAIHQFFDKNNFFWLPTPMITSSDCEGAGELFHVSNLDLLNLPRTEKGAIDFQKDFFGQETFLTVSGQLNAEAYASAISRVYTFGPTFRAENSNTSRHLAEFWMIEPEMAFADLNEDATLAENLLKFVFQYVLDHCADDMKFFVERIDSTCVTRLEHFVQTSFVRMDYAEAVRILEKAERTFEFPVRFGIDLQSEHERYLCEEYVKGPVVVMNYPKGVKAFYMRLNDDGQTVAAMDVLAPGIGEIIGGSQREERLEVLDTRMTELNLPHEAMGWYRDLRRYGTVPHAGFGLGFERLLSYITGLNNVRDVSPFPRTPGHVKF